MAREVLPVAMLSFTSFDISHFKNFQAKNKADFPHFMPRPT